MGGSVGSVGSEGVGNNGVVFTYMYIAAPIILHFGGVDKETIIFASSFLL